MLFRIVKEGLSEEMAFENNSAMKAILKRKGIFQIEGTNTQEGFATKV